MRQFTILLRENRTGEVRTLNEPERETTSFGKPFLYDAHTIAFNWFENNFSCDCNRQIMFARAYGQEEFDVPCGEELFSARMVDQATGEVFAQDDSW